MKPISIAALALLLCGCSSFNFQRFGVAVCGSDCEFVNRPAATASSSEK